MSLSLVAEGPRRTEREQAPVAETQENRTEDKLAQELRIGLQTSQQAVEQITRLLESLRSTSLQGGVEIPTNDLQAHLVRMQAEMAAISGEIQRRTGEAAIEKRWGGVMKEKAEQDAALETATQQIGELYRMVYSTRERIQNTSQEVPQESFTWKRFEEVANELNAEKERLRDKVFQKDPEAPLSEVAQVIQVYVERDEVLGGPRLRAEARQMLEEERARFDQEFAAFEQRAVELWNIFYPEQPAQDKTDLDGTRLMNPPDSADPVLVEEVRALMRRVMAHQEEHEALRSAAWKMDDARSLALRYGEVLISRSVQEFQEKSEALEQKLVDAVREPYVRSYIEQSLRPKVTSLVQDKGLSPTLAERFLTEFQAFTLAGQAGEFSFSANGEDPQSLLYTLGEKNEYRFRSIEHTLHNRIGGRLALDRGLKLKHLEETLFEAFPAAEFRDAYQKECFSDSGYRRIQAGIQRSVEYGFSQLNAFGSDMADRERVLAKVMPVDRLFTKEAEELAAAALTFADAKAGSGFGIYRQIAESSKLDLPLLTELMPTLVGFEMLAQEEMRDFYSVMEAVPPQQAGVALKVLAACKERHGARGFEVLLKVVRERKGVDLVELARGVDELMDAGLVETAPKWFVNKAVPLLLACSVEERAKTVMAISQLIGRGAYGAELMQHVVLKEAPTAFAEQMNALHEFCEDGFADQLPAYVLLLAADTLAKVPRAERGRYFALGEDIRALRESPGGKSSVRLYTCFAERTGFNLALLASARTVFANYRASLYDTFMLVEKYVKQAEESEIVEGLAAVFELQKTSGDIGVELALAWKNQSKEAIPLAMAVEQVRELVKDPFIFQIQKKFLLEGLATFIATTPEHRRIYAEVVERVLNSPSQAVQRIKYELAGQLLQTEDPIRAYERIEQVFIRNHQPAVGKVFRVFEVLNTAQVIENKLHQVEGLCPTLKAQGDRQRLMTTYQDLMTVHVEGANPSLKAYLELLVDAKPILEKLERGGAVAAELTLAEQAQFMAFAKKIKALYESSQLGRMNLAEDTSIEVSSPDDALHIYQSWKEDLRMLPGVSVTDRVAEMFFKPLGYATLEDVLARMDTAKRVADGRARDLVAGASGKLSIQAGDLLKAIDHNYITSILQNGSVAKEFLGPSADSDCTPLDTDLSRVLPADAELGLQGAIGRSLSGDGSYGRLLMVVRPRGQFVETSSAQPEEELRALHKKSRGKYELFCTAVLDKERHMGIRTGFPATEIDYFVMKPEIYSDAKEREYVFMEIAQNGFYVPVTNETGEIVFTPAMFDEYRRLFRGQAGVSTALTEEVPLQEGASYERRLLGPEGEVAKKREDIAVIKTMTQRIHGVVNEALLAAGVSLHEATGDSIVGAQLFDVGSSARFTNVPGSYDFDINVRLDANDMRKVSEVMEKIRAAMKADKGESYSSGEGVQLRLYGAYVQGETVDIDLAFTSKSDLVVFNSHDSAKARLEAIEREQGKEAYERVLANISLAKQMLKQAHAYKRLEDGGIGGMGVENWILAHRGSLAEACKSFAQASKGSDGARVSFSEFQERYHMLDPGINEKFKRHDNYVRLMKDAAYTAMADVVDAFLSELEGAPQAVSVSGPVLRQAA